MYWGNADAFEILAFDLSRPAANQPARIIRYAAASRAVDGAVLDRYLDFMLERSRSAVESLAHHESRKTRPFRSTLPAYRSLITDSEGNLWTEHFRARSMAGLQDDPREPNTWTVFDTSGTVVGDVRTPAGLRVMQIGTDWMLGIWADADSVQHVRVHTFGELTR